MVISGEVNLITCSTDVIVDLREALEVAYLQRVKAVTKRSRAGQYESLTPTEKRLVDSKKHWKAINAPYIIIDETDYYSSNTFSRRNQ